MEMLAVVEKHDMVVKQTDDVFMFRSQNTKMKKTKNYLENLLNLYVMKRKEYYQIIKNV